METKKEKIDKVKQSVKTVLDIVLQYKKAKKDDGKISPMEYLGFIDEALAVLKMVPQAKAILIQLEDVDDAETIELVEYIQSFGLLKEKAVLILKNVLQALEKIYDVYTDNVVPIIEALKK